MTPDNLELCRKLAEAEGWTDFSVYEEEGYPGKTIFAVPPHLKGIPYGIPLPAYLTDPAEQMRMTKKLLLAGFSLHRYSAEGMFVWNFPGWGGTSIMAKHEEYETATAEAYLAMLTGGKEGE